MLQEIKKISIGNNAFTNSLCEELPDSFVFKGKVEKGLQDSAAGNVYCKDEAKQKLSYRLSCVE